MSLCACKDNDKTDNTDLSNATTKEITESIEATAKVTDTEETTPEDSKSETVSADTSAEAESESQSENQTSIESDTEDKTFISTETESETESESEETTQIQLPPTEGNINPQFSIAGGIYESSTSLTLSLPANVEGYEIYYTTDGSLPTTSSKKYTSPITLSKNLSAVVIRAACFKNSALPAGKVITNTYIFDRKVASKLWTVSITAAGSELDYLIENYNETIEIPSHTEIITPEGELVISQDTGLRIFGGSSRSLAQKSFKIIARKNDRLGSDIYIGKGSFSYPLFEDRIIKSGAGAGQILQKIR